MYHEIHAFTPRGWDLKFLNLAQYVSREWSKDPSTQVGAVAVGVTPNLFAVGYNGFPPGILDTDKRLADREMKYKLTNHAEVNALANAKFEITQMYCTHIPCIRCAVNILAYRSIKHVKAWLPTEDYMSRWSDDVEASTRLFVEAGVNFSLFRPL